MTRPGSTALARITGLLGVLALATAACGGLGRGSDAPTVDGGSVDGDWELVAGQVDGDPLEAPGDHRITLSIEGDEVGGRAACNSYGGEIAVDGADVSIGTIAVTEMACQPPAVMEAETAYLEALLRVDHAERDDELVLTGPGVDLRYREVEPVPTAELVGTEWVLDGLVDGDGPSAGVSSTTGERATLLLADDGTLRASTGCRELEGVYTVDGDEIVITELSADLECPEELAAQDDHVVAVLGDGFRVEIDGDRLSVTSRDGRGLVYRADR